MTDECDNPRHKHQIRRAVQAERDILFWKNAAERKASELAQLKLELRWRKYEDKNNVAWLQRKVLAQRQHLAALQQRDEIRALREEDPKPDPGPD